MTVQRVEHPTSAFEQHDMNAIYRGAPRDNYGYQFEQMEDLEDEEEAQSPNFNDYNISTDGQIQRNKKLQMMELADAGMSPG